jgi:hypothetical protein
MTCASVTIRLRKLLYVNRTSQSVTYVSGTFVTLDPGLNTPYKGGGHQKAQPYVLPMPKLEEPKKRFLIIS